VAENIIRLEDVRKSYDVGQSSETEILHGIDLSVEQGEFLALIGVSGSGKSTLLNIIGLLDRPTSGRLTIKGDHTAAMTDEQITRLRGHAIGFVFQAHHLIFAFTALENIMMPMLVDRGFPSPEIVARATDLLARVGLSTVADNLAGNMSGGRPRGSPWRAPWR
jgi:lipoprotein-releasing system ATP-binding protein